MICPSCGHTFTTTKPRQTTDRPKPPADTAHMSKAELYAHYKATAPLEDVRFWIRCGKMSPAVTHGLMALESAIVTLKLSRTTIYTQFLKLQEQWRHENYWRTVLLPQERLDRRWLKAIERQHRQIRRETAA